MLTGITAHNVDHNPWLEKPWAASFTRPLLFPWHIDTMAPRKYKITLWLYCEPSCCYTEHLKRLAHHSQNSWEWDAAPDPVRTTGVPGSFTEGGGRVKGNEAGRTKGGRMYILKQRGCLLSLAADPTCRWSTQSPGRSKSQGPGWTSLWNGNGA